MQAKVQKWGNSLALRIPRSVAEDAQLHEGVKVLIQTRQGKVIVEPVRSKKYKLQSLLARVTRSNIHNETKTGNPIGKEIW
jgi:antitoxin MazE